MSSLVEELISSALDREESVPQLLRKAQIAAVRLDIAELRAWTEAELGGYAGTAYEDVPEYREVLGELRGWYEPLGRWLPVFDIHDGTRCSYSMRLPHPIGQIETVFKGGDAIIEYAGEQKTIVMKALSGVAPTRVGVIVAAAKLEGILDRVRDRVLKWALDLEKSGEIGEGRSLSSAETKVVAEVRPQFTTQINNSFGTIQTLNLQQGNISASQTLTTPDLERIRQVVEGLRQARTELFLGEDGQGVLDASIETLKAQGESPTPSVRIIVETLNTLRTVAEGFVASYLASKFGIHIDQILRALGVQL